MKPNKLIALQQIKEIPLCVKHSKIKPFRKRKSYTVKNDSIYNNNARLVLFPKYISTIINNYE